MATLGRLGNLAMDYASRMARAREMGFNPDERWIHGTPVPDIEQFRGNVGSAGHFTQDPSFAQDFSRMFHPHWDAAPTSYPVLLRDQNNLFEAYDPESLSRLRGSVATEKEREALQNIRGGLFNYYDLENLVDPMKQAGFSGYRDYEFANAPSTGVAVFDPKNIRSVFARFDPRQSESGNILAGVLPAAVGLGALATPQESEAAFAGKLARGADTMMMDIAQKMKAAGIGRDEIWQKTGWFQGPDQQWRFEIPDDEAVMRQAVSPMQLQFMGDVMDSPTVSAYGLEDMPIYGSRSKGRERGAYSPVYEDISINPERPLSEQRSTLLHETQHAIQNREGFAPGGNPRAFIGSEMANEPDFDPFDAYRRLAGEVEARNVQFRDVMDPARRRKVAPWDTADVRERDQLLPDPVTGGYRRPTWDERRAVMPNGYATPGMLGALSAGSGGALAMQLANEGARAAGDSPFLRAIEQVKRTFQNPLLKYATPAGALLPEASLDLAGRLATGKQTRPSDYAWALLDWL